MSKPRQYWLDHHGGVYKHEEYETPSFTEPEIWALYIEKSAYDELKDKYEELRNALILIDWKFDEFSHVAHGHNGECSSQWFVNRVKEMERTIQNALEQLAASDSAGQEGERSELTQ